MSTATEGLRQIDPCAVVQRRHTGDNGFVLLDVREAAELQLARVSGVIHIPMNDVPARLQELDPQRETIVMCHHGGRSSSVAAFLIQQGFADVKNLRGGIHAWAQDVDPSVGMY